jgi:hypothetical protein
MSRVQLAEYFTTQSNVSAVVDRCDESLAGVTDWLLDALAPYYRESEEERFPFGGSAWLLQLLKPTRQGALNPDPQHTEDRA